MRMSFLCASVGYCSNRLSGSPLQSVTHPCEKSKETGGCVAECREVSHAVACHDVNVEPDVSPAHAVEEGVFGWFEVVCHIFKIL